MKGIESNTIPIATLERDILGARIVPIRSAWIAKWVLVINAAWAWAGGLLRVGTTRAPGRGGCGARIVPIRSAWIAKRVLGFYAARVWAGGVLRVGTTRAPRKFFKQTGQFGV